MKITIKNMKVWTYQDCTCATYWDGYMWGWSAYHQNTGQSEQGRSKAENKATAKAKKTARKFAKAV